MERQLRELYRVTVLTIQCNLFFLSIYLRRFYSNIGVLVNRIEMAPHLADIKYYLNSDANDVLYCRYYFTLKHG